MRSGSPDISRFALLLALVLGAPSHDAWAYGWTAHWRVMDSNRETVTAKLCATEARTLRAFKELTDEEMPSPAVKPDEAADDGLPKMEDVPNEMGGSGEAIPE